MNQGSTRPAFVDSPDHSDAATGVPARRTATTVGADWLREQLLDARAWGRRLGPNFTGLAFAGLFFYASLTPSLLPRSGIFQGIISGCVLSIGYFIGVVFAALGRGLFRFARPDIRERCVRFNAPARLIVIGVLVVTEPVQLYRSFGWQREVYELMGHPTPGNRSWMLLVAGMSVGIFLAALWSARALLTAARFVGREINRFLRVPPHFAAAIGILVVVVSGAFILDGVVLNGAFGYAEHRAATHNDGTRAGTSQPSEPERSGSPASLVDYDGLGNEGRRFVSNGLRAREMHQFDGTEYREPIRVYAGLGNAADGDDRVQLIVDELIRTNAADRKYLVVIPTTGSGWVNPTAARSLELMYHGDIALAAAQYSFLPSWLSFLLDGDKAKVFGRKLIDGVSAWWSTLPEDRRPKLLVMGESLGTTAAEGAFDDVADFRGKVDGAVLIGPPAASKLSRSLAERRDPGSPYALPRYAAGLSVRFISGTEPYGTGPLYDPSPWIAPHVVYIEHASDPVVRWDTDLITQKPAWLSEPPVGDRTRRMSWFPIVTFWQVSADLANAAAVPDGHGHNYGLAVIDAMAAVARPDDWSPARADTVRVIAKVAGSIDGPER